MTEFVVCRSADLFIISRNSFEYDLTLTIICNALYKKKKKPCSSILKRNLQAFASTEGTPPAEACVLVDGLKTALRTRAHSFVLRFIKQGGLGSLLDALQKAPRDDAVTRHNLIAAIKALMNNSVS